MDEDDAIRVALRRVGRGDEEADVQGRDRRVTARERPTAPSTSARPGRRSGPATRNGRSGRCGTSGQERGLLRRDPERRGGGRRREQQGQDQQGGEQRKMTARRKAGVYRDHGAAAEDEGRECRVARPAGSGGRRRCERRASMRRRGCRGGSGSACRAAGTLRARRPNAARCRTAGRAAVPRRVNGRPVSIQCANALASTIGRAAPAASSSWSSEPSSRSVAYSALHAEQGGEQRADPHDPGCDLPQHLRLRSDAERKQARGHDEERDRQQDLDAPARREPQVARDDRCEDRRCGRCGRCGRRGRRNRHAAATASSCTMRIARRIERRRDVAREQHAATRRRHAR